MSNYFATELGLTKATRALMAKGVCKAPEPVTVDDHPYVKQDNSPVKTGYGKRKVHSKLTEVQIEDFQRNRIFTVIRNNNYIAL